MKAVTTN